MHDQANDTREFSLREQKQIPERNFSMLLMNRVSVSKHVRDKLIQFINLIFKEKKFLQNKGFAYLLYLCRF